MRISNQGIYSAISTFQNLGERILFSFVQLYADLHGATTADQGTLLSFRNIISFSGQQIFGRASDRLGRVIILSFGFLLASISSILLLETTTPLSIIIVFAFYALAFSAIQPSFNALIGDTFDENRTEMIGAITSVGGLLGGFSFLFVGLFGDTMDDPYSFLFTIAAISFFAAALVVGVLVLIRKVPPQERDTVKQVNIFEPLKTGFFKKFVMIDGLYGLAMSTSWPLFPKRTNELADTAQVTIMWAATFIGFAITARYTAQIKKMIGSYNKSFFYSRFFLWMVPLSFAFATSWLHLIFARIIAGLTFGFYSTLQKDYVLEAVKKINRPNHRGWYFGTHAFVFGISTFVGSLGFGFLAEYLYTIGIGYSEMFLLSAFIRLVFVFAYIKVPNI